MLRETPWTVARGFAMGTADVVPGVSGGTVALVFGIYERLVSSVKAASSALGHLLAGNWSRARRWLGEVEWSFLAALVAGIALAIVTLAGLLGRLLDERPIEMAALFFGLVAGSIVVAWRLVTTPNAVRVGIAVSVGLAVFILLGLRSGTEEETVRQVVDPALWGFLLSGALAICAMILPGISGSLMLVLVGMYRPVLDAVNDRRVGRLALFVAGTVFGLAVFSQLLHWALAKYHDSVMAALVGLMAGSVRVLWPWPDGISGSSLAGPDDAIPAAVVLSLAAFLVVLAVDRLARRGGALPKPGRRRTRGRTASGSSTGGGHSP